MEYQRESVDVLVVGAGHAGIEAALAAARMGCETVLFSLNLDAVGNMPCNPSIGGTGKGHLVFEIDALGGQMGKTADKACLQSRMLNRGKGPAVHSLRMQEDRVKYRVLMKRELENCEHLSLIQAEVVELRRDGEYWQAVTRLGAIFTAKALILCSGTYLRGSIIVGEVSYSGGPDGMFPSDMLSDSLRKLGLPLMRFKTGTPARLHADSIDYSVLELQSGDECPEHFSSEENNAFHDPNLPCYIAYTNETTHQIIRDNLHLSPIYSGRIKGIGPRYCPSIEDKVVRFADKTRHQLFIEPMGDDTKEVYLQGFSSSLPEKVQLEMLHSIRGLEHARVMRNAYAIEYDCVDPLALAATLEFTEFSGLFGAGQFNGTSGYEEAAAQGLIAGINAALHVKGEEKLILPRNSSYIGTLIDDLVTKGTNEPYRIMTSRSEYRLLLRQDNADRRLTEIGYRVGLVSEDSYRAFCEKKDRIESEIERIRHVSFGPSEELFALLDRYGSARCPHGIKMTDLLRRPEITYEALAPIDSGRPSLSVRERAAVEIEIKYEGYIQKEQNEAKRFEKLESKKLPDDIDYDAIGGIRAETRQKLSKFRPKSVGQASRISGVSPADISVLLIYLESRYPSDAANKAAERPDQTDRAQKAGEEA